MRRYSQLKTGFRVIDDGEASAMRRKPGTSPRPFLKHEKLKPQSLACVTYSRRKALATSHQAVGRLLPSICFSCFLRRHHPQSLVVFRLGLFTLIPGTTQFTLVMRGVGCPPRAMLLGQGSFPRHLATTGTPQQAPDASQSSQLCSRAYIQHWLRCRPLAQ
jgi:hypothetical protein